MWRVVVTVSIGVLLAGFGYVLIAHLVVFSVEHLVLVHVLAHVLVLVHVLILARTDLWIWSLLILVESS